ncbi:hypothetical protein QBC39DRAFT_162320 [Podospora conica]|nr:hypothetical protein QBC39DRAFT_162320 [Schizothecium conicum]
MGHLSRFNFPIPGRKSKPVPPPPASPLNAPRTKADKILGTGDVLDDTTLESPKYAWETRSLSAISISVSDTTASHAGTGPAADKDVTVRPSTMGKNKRWEEESEVLPRGFQEQIQLHTVRTAHETITDASSLRRRQSSSTITSYYDKTKLPLSISQQTSNSAMAKGLPSKAQLLLDMEGSYVDASAQAKKKKPARLDLSSLIPGRSKSKFLSPRGLKGLVLGPDLVTKSPSAMSVSTGDATPPPISQRAERSLRKKATKESMRDVVPPVPELPPHHLRMPTVQEGSRHRHTKSTVDLMNLYDHYEQRTFADADGVEDGQEPQVEPAASYPTPPASSCGNGYLAPDATNPIRIVVACKEAPPTTNPHDLLMGMSPMSLITPPPDNASVSSRHTRTSKASKQTNLSLTDLDLQQNSMLSLSSDSEDDDYAVSSKSSLAVPPLSDGQPSPTSSHSVGSQKSTATVPQESNRPKVPKRTSFAVQPQFHPIPEGSATANAMHIGPRSSSLVGRMAVQKPRSSLVHSTSMSSIAYTGKIVPPPSALASDTNMPPPRGSPPRQANWSAPAPDRFDDFPTPPAPHSRQQSLTPSNREPTPPLSPTSVDFYLQERLSRTTFDNQSIRSGRSLGSGSTKDVQRGGTPLGHQHNDSTGSASGRFMAVTRQEEMLLAALRQKRARMREDILAELEDNDADDDGGNLRRQTTNSSSAMSRQSSRSTMRTMDGAGLGAPSARLQRIANQRVPSIDEHGRGQILVMMDRTAMGGIDTAEPSPDLDGFLDFDNEINDFPAIPTSRSAPRQRSSSKASIESKGSSRSLSGKGSLSALTRVQFGSTDSSSTGSGSRRGSDRDVIQEDPRESMEDEAGIPRPDSPISPDDFPLPASMSSRKQVRLSAVGTYRPPNIEAGWWDDSG